MKKAHYFIFSGLAVIAICAGAFLAGQSSATASLVLVAFCGTTNAGPGSIAYCFEATNGMPQAVLGSYAVEVFCKGIWFNAPSYPWVVCSHRVACCL